MSGQQTYPLQLLNFRVFFSQPLRLNSNTLRFQVITSCLISVTFPKGPAPALELKKPLKRLAARFFHLSGPGPMLGREPLICPRASGVGIFVSPRNSVMFFLRRAWPYKADRAEKILYSVKETMTGHTTENETRQTGMSDFVISTGNIKVSSWTGGMRQ